ncbi:lysine--tRNA ligase [bacterium]|jgi:lysyl-tRNA synthetase, class II|nr:lysine--tRNA ligase [bacterium]
MEEKNTDIISEQDSREKDSAEHQIRLKKVKELRDSKINPWPTNVKIKNTCVDAIKTYKDGQEEDGPDISAAGRLIGFRLHGKTSFGHIQDRTGKVQVYFKKDLLGDDRFEFLKKYIDRGDIISVAGPVFKTKTGEITLKVKSFSLLSKCLHPLPEKFHGIADIELKYRQRYLDLISSEETRKRFKIRSKVVSLFREDLEKKDFIEVETPMLHPIPGGAVAKPFVTHHNALDTEFYLRIAPELYLKRLVVGGLERVYEINRCFRNEGLSTRHNPEFTTIELYWAYEDYDAMMDLIEDIIKKSVTDVYGKTSIPLGKNTIDYGKPFERLAMKDAVIKYGNVDEKMLSEKNIDVLISEHKIKIANKNAGWGQKLFALFEELVEDKLIQPTFIIDFPVEVSPLAKRYDDNPDFVARFELYIGGMEIANGFNELNDPFDQAERFNEQVAAREAGDDEAHFFDQEYITALEHGLPPTVGAGIGIDRLVMLLTDTLSIKEVILFPTLKKKD